MLAYAPIGYIGLTGAFPGKGAIKLRTYDEEEFNNALKALDEKYGVKPVRTWNHPMGSPTSMPEHMHKIMYVALFNPEDAVFVLMMNKDCLVT